ncbi:MAG: PhzF family phenazine biosynthesis protein [Cyanobacteria bacterium P01_A01_bin.83]
MRQPVVQVDAFTKQKFRGNPAAVCVLSSPQDDQWLQSVAREMNLSETAFLMDIRANSEDVTGGSTDSVNHSGTSHQQQQYDLRWFTPATEVPLCGHATLASAHVLWTEGYADPSQDLQFKTKSGVLTARSQNDWIELNFPVSRSQDIPPITKLGDALGVPIKTVSYNSLGYLVEIATAQQVSQLQPNFTLLQQLPISNVIVTSKADASSEYDFVSRFFAPGLGINEDPVTGAAHCCLAPYWRDRLQKDQMIAYQASERGGVIKINYDGGDRVNLLGQAVTVMRGELV